MKKIFVYIFMLLFLLVPGFSVSAASLSDYDIDSVLKSSIENRTDDKGHITSGYWHYNHYGVSRTQAVLLFNILDESKKDNELFYYLTYYQQAAGTSYFRQYTLHGVRLSDFREDLPGYVEFASYNYNFDPQYFDSSFDKGKLSFGVGTISSVPLDAGLQFYAERDFFDTNIPVFNRNDTSAINAYINEGDVSGADNAEDILSGGDPEYDENIELPQNAKVSGKYTFSLTKNVTDYIPLFVAIKNASGSKLLSLSWSIPDDRELMYDLDIRGDYTADSGLLSSPWYSITTGGSYLGDAVIYDIVNDNLNLNLLNDYLTDFVKNNSSIKDCPSISFRIRNCKDGKCSKWVVVSITEDGKGSAHVEDKDGNVEYTDEYDGSNGYDTNGDNGSSKEDSDNGKVNYDDISIAGIMGYIRGGFGLLGNNGIIALMSKTYLYLPASIWTIITFYISMLVVIALIRAIKEVLF